MASRLLTPNCSPWLASSTIRERRSITTPTQRHGAQAMNASLELVPGGVELQRRLGLRGGMLCRVKAEEGEEEVTTATTTEREMDDEEPVTSVTQAALWVMAAVYTSYLFFLPFAPGDPVWAISPATITGVLNLSFNFFYVLPLANLDVRGSLSSKEAVRVKIYTMKYVTRGFVAALRKGHSPVRGSPSVTACRSDIVYLSALGRAVGFHLLEAAVVHPVDEALFNFVLGWALLFAPLIFTDRKRDRFTGSLDLFWLASMFLTNTFLIPYMAIRLNKGPNTRQPQEPSVLQRAFTNGARIVAGTGAVIGLLSIVWFVIGRPTEGYGDLAERWSYWIDAISKDRVTYAFIWDLCCFTVFQPWLIGDNLHNIRNESKELVGTFRFLPYVGLVAYCWGLDRSKAAKLQ